MPDFTHLDSEGKAVMVDVGGKAQTSRQAIASGKIFMGAECFRKVSDGSVEKGDVLSVARVAGIMAVKQTPSLIPLCHPILVEKAEIAFEVSKADLSIQAICTVKTTGTTGVEMEALTGASVALLTSYDMCKAIDKEMEIGSICLQAKTGGKSGDFFRNRGTLNDA
jgi:cyclic pyranopterin phosphate synthase